MRGGRVHPAWIVAAAGLVALVMAAGLRSTAGVLLVPLHDEFGWSHETIGLAVSLNLLFFGVGAPFAAALVEWVGLRRVVAGSLAVIAASSLLTIGMTEPWQLFLLWGVVNGLATGAVSVPLAAIIANRWFVRRRGLVTGLLTASNASGQLVFLPALAWVAGFDWRYAAALVAGRPSSSCRSSPPSSATGRATSACGPSATTGCVEGRCCCSRSRSARRRRP